MQRQTFDFYYLNLNQSVRKANHMIQILNYMNLTYERVNSVDGKKLVVEANHLKQHKYSNLIKFNDSVIVKTVSQDLRPQLACYLSYLLLMKKISALNTNRPSVVVEDDVDLNVDLASIINSSLADLPSDWEILLCGYCCLTIDQQTNKFYSIKGYATTHCQVFRNSQVAEKISQLLDTGKMEAPIDLYLSKLVNEGKIKAYALLKPVAVQRRDLFSTDIPTSGSLSIDYVQNSVVDLMTQKSLYKLV